MSLLNLAVLGATGLVGQTIIEQIEKRDIAYKSLRLFASKSSAGRVVTVNSEDIVIEELTEEVFDGSLDIALFAVESHLSAKFAPLAVSSGCTVIDNSSAFRMDENIPLVVPEVNAELIKDYHGIIANPNCSTIQSVVALAPLRQFGLKRVAYTTYQAVSGSGRGGLEDLERGLKGQENEFYPHPIAFNVLPHIDSFLANGYSKEEIKMIEESRKILDLPELKATATAVRVPVRYGHCVEMNIEFTQEFALDEVRSALEKGTGLNLLDAPSENIYPTPLQAAGQDPVFVGRLRRDISQEKGIHLWSVADNVLKGAALNAVQILEYLIAHR